MIAAALAVAGSTRAQEQMPSPYGTPAACSALVTLGGAAMYDPSGVITSASFQPASQGTTDAPAAGRGAGRGAPPTGPLPAHCEVLGELQRHNGPNGQSYAVKFRLRMPADWNGRFFFQGGGGSNGNIGQATGNLLGAQASTAINMGYSVVTQDSGHDNALNNDPMRGGTATFGFDDQARRNYGFASIGPVTRASKALIVAFYAKAPQYSYFVGSSKGGQEAFMAAQRFGEMFDGILAGYPGFRLATAGAVGEMWDDQAFGELAKKAGALDANGLPLINKTFTDADLALASDAILAACDTLDGTKDGMVENFRDCSNARVYPELAKVTCKAEKTDACLSADQAAALKKVYGGAKDFKGKQLYATWPWDAGIGGKAPNGYFTGWRQWKIGSYASEQNNASNITLAGSTVSTVFTSPPTEVPADPASLTKYVMSQDVEKFDAQSKAKWGSFNESSVDFMNADSTDLKSFTRHGGKLLIYHGVSDPVFSINDTIAWWNRVNAVEKGQAARFVRLFPVPGMNHGGGGPSTDQIDLFSALVAWTEKGRAPASLIATARATTNWPGRTRLLCPYPLQPRLNKNKDPEKAESFTCKKV
jgi:feruloyl esterase